jgi:ribonucrease Y
MGIEFLSFFIVSLGSATAAVIAYRILWRHSLKNEMLKAELESRKLISEAEISSKRLMDAAQFEQDKRKNLLEQQEVELEKALERMAEQTRQLEEKEGQFEQRSKKLEEIEKTCDAVRKSYLEKLASMSSVSSDTIKDELIAQITQDSENELQALRRQLHERTESEVENEARDMLLSAMQRITINPATDATATIVDLPSEDMKGRIIGREGRNIRSFEAVTGTTLMIDETPDSVLISAFDPVKREIARLALETLLKDGRIHPSTIETAYEQAKNDVQKNVKTLGEEAMSRLKLKPAHPEILKLLGQLHFRLSLNQNSLEHSIEVAFIASMLASELGLDPTLAKRAALFHDIGKAIDHEFEGSHAQIAAKMIERYNEDPIVVNAVAASHEEVPAESVYAPLIVIADRISAIRPGARCDSLDSYVDRVKNLEDIAKGFEGVKEAFALQAGREIRVIVEPTQLSDDDSRELARSISREIENSLNYPSTIKITVIREQRFCETAK